MKQGFTLIELLAVIVILAIIATIAVPIVLNIINDSKESSNQRSLDMYKKAVENAVASYRLNFPEDNNIKLYKLYKKYNGKKDFIEYSGSEIDCDVYIYSTGNVYITNCKIEGKEILTSDSTEENKKYYSVGEDTIEAHIGEKVNYTATGTSYTGDWKILGVENGKILLISNSIGSLKLYGREDYKNAISTMDSMCAPYASGTKAESARSVRASDINKITGYNPSKTGNGKKSEQGKVIEYGNTVTFSYKDGGVYSSSTNGLNGQSTTYTKYENLDGTVISSDNPNNVITHTSSYYFYYFETLTEKYNVTEESVGIKKGTDEYNLIVDKTILYSSGDIIKNYTYWVADQVVCPNESRTSWQIRFMSDSGCVAETLYHSFDGDTGSELYQYGRGRGVRAVVTLSADAKLVYDEQTSMWNIE